MAQLVTQRSSHLLSSSLFLQLQTTSHLVTLLSTFNICLPWLMLSQSSSGKLDIFILLLIRQQHHLTIGSLSTS